LTLLARMDIPFCTSRKNHLRCRWDQVRTLAERTKIPVVSDLRSSDVAAGGQGAPIVPIGEKYLFPKCNAFLNIGGIANIALHEWR
jgi:1,6-anhydro-N-acetylmuramate kinase